MPNKLKLQIPKQKKKNRETCKQLLKYWKKKKKDNTGNPPQRTHENPKNIARMQMYKLPFTFEIFLMGKRMLFSRFLECRGEVKEVEVEGLQRTATWQSGTGRSGWVVYDVSEDYLTKYGMEN